jgi:hypothetical protein
MEKLILKTLKRNSEEPERPYPVYIIRPLTHPELNVSASHHYIVFFLGEVQI